MRHFAFMRWYYIVPAILLNVLLVILFLRDREGVQAGDATEFWAYACGVRVREYNGHMKYSYHGGIYPNIKKEYFYFTQMHHQQHVYRVTRHQLEMNFAEVLSILDNDSKTFKNSNEKEQPFSVYGNSRPDPVYKKTNEILDNMGVDEDRISSLNTKCRLIIGENRKDIDKFLNQLKRDSANDESQWRNPEYLNSVLQKSKNLWRVFVFEFLFLNGWLVFICWPGFIRASSFRWGVHIGLGCFTILFPYYFGYSDIFNFGLTGTLLYVALPMILYIPFLFMNFITPFDIFILNNLPKSLGFLTAGPEVWAAKSYYGSLGVIGPLIYSFLIGLLTYWVHKFKHRKRFE